MGAWCTPEWPFTQSFLHPLNWKPIIDPEIKEGKHYLISDKQFEYRGTAINVVEAINGHYRVISIRSNRKEGPYLCFDVASDVKKKGQKQLLLHRARLISFSNEVPIGLIVRHGNAGRSCHDLENLEWGTHEDNMDDAKNHGSHKGQNNASSKIREDLALSIYIYIYII